MNLLNLIDAIAICRPKRLAEKTRARLLCELRPAPTWSHIFVCSLQIDRRAGGISNPVLQAAHGEGSCSAQLGIHKLTPVLKLFSKRTIKLQF